MHILTYTYNSLYPIFRGPSLLHELLAFSKGDLKLVAYFFPPKISM